MADQIGQMKCEMKCEQSNVAYQMWQIKCNIKCVINVADQMWDQIGKIKCEMKCDQSNVGSAEHFASPKPGTKKNWFGTSHFVKQLVRKQ